MVEVVTVLAVIAVLAAVAVRGLQPSGAGLTGEASLLASRLRYTQAMALAGGAQYVWGLEIGADRYALVRDGVQPAGVSLPNCASAEYSFPAGIRVSAGVGRVSFDAWGNPGDADIAITVTDGRSSQVVTVTGLTGFAR